jgi:hypothetical protein
MQVPPPPKIPARRRSFSLLILVVVVGLVLVACGILGVRAVIKSGITKGPDNVFGDQHLKTAVALIELHKLRFGRYPKSLSELKFVGQWDEIALQSVRYYSNPEGTAYYVEVERGWVGKPDLEMPDEFWHGTGYTTTLKPRNP